MSFFEEVTERKSLMNEYEYNTAMADVSVLNAIAAYTNGDGALMTFFKNAEIEFRRRALGEKECLSTKVERITKLMQNSSDGILKHGIKTPFGECIY